MCPAVVERRAYGQRIVAAPNFVGVDHLPADADGARLCLVVVVLAEVERSTLRDVGNDSTHRVMHWGSVQARKRRTGGNVSPVAVYVLLVELAEIGPGLEIQRGRIGVTGCPLEHDQLVIGRLRDGVDAAPIRL